MPESNRATGTASRKRAARGRLLAELEAAGREYSNVVVMFHAAVAEQLGLSATENKTLDLLERHGSLSPGRLSELTGLRPASVTGVLDRLEARGFVRRLRDPADGRRQLVELDASQTPRIEALFTGLIRDLRKLHEEYSTAELELILDWLTKVAAIQRNAAIELTGATPD